ncbi:MAG TPA: DUF1569 domain-containing protein [Holophagaceae bacterium]|nr:DUF1569 domain-containing protein [Holophagaceae bacterium]
MENLFDPADLARLLRRIQALGPDSPRRWGSMDAAQAVAHCADALEMALGDRRPPRALLGRLIGRWIKPLALRPGEPMRRNSPTSRELVVTEARDLEDERARLLERLGRIEARGPAGCSDHPHPFFGPLTGEEWGVLMHKHLDHHLRQFGV